MVHTEEKEDAIQQLIRCSCYTVYRIDVEHRVETWQDKLFVLMSVAEGEGTLNGTRPSDFRGFLHRTGECLHKGMPHALPWGISYRVLCQNRKNRRFYVPCGSLLFLFGQLM